MSGPEDSAERTALAPVRRLLTRLDVDAVHETVADVARTSGALADVARVLRERGIDARVQSARARDLAGFTLPTLVALREGGLALVTDVRRGRIAIEDANGRTTWLRVGRDDEVLAGDAIDIDPPVASERGVLGAVVAHVRRSPPLRRAFALLTLASLIRSVVALAPPLLIRAAMDGATSSGSYGLLSALALAMVVVALQESFVIWTSERASRFIEARSRYAAVRGAFARGISLPFAEMQRRGFGAFVQDLMSSEEIAHRLLGTVSASGFDLVMVFVYLGLLASTSALVAGLVVSGAVLIFVIGVVQGIRAGERMLVTLRRGERQRSELDELLAGVLTLKHCVAERERGARWYDAFVREQLAGFEANRIDMFNKRTVTLVRQLAIAAVLLLTGARAVSQAMTIGDVVLCGQLAAGLLGAAERLTALPMQMRVLAFHVERVGALFSRTTESVSGPRRSRGAPEAGTAIELEEVWFRYGPDEPWLFRGFSMSVRFGETRVVSWPSGGGKTTLLRLIAGLHLPERGTITVAGRSPQRARELIAYLPQTSVVFEGSIRKNLELLSGAAPLERIEAAAAATGFADVLAAMPMGIETRLSRRGTNLSGGQRQLLLFTAALASARPILLLDESLAHVDGITRARLRASGLFEGRAVVIVSHQDAPRRSSESEFGMHPKWTIPK